MQTTPSSLVEDRAALTRFAWLAVAAAVLTMALKGAAYWLTGSVGLLSDALESLVNLAGALMALAMLAIAARPPDEEHAYGHSKAEYFSSVIEGALILVAAASIAVEAAKRLVAPRPLEQIGVGLAVAVGAALVNMGVALVLLDAGRRHHSIALEASARHLLTDVWTSAGVVTGVGLGAVTAWHRLDPIVALAVAANIVWTGVRLVNESVSGLMDVALPPDEQEALRGVLARYLDLGVHYHALRTRQAGPRRFVSVHVLVPGDWSVQRGHELLEHLEADVHAALPYVSILTHLEPIEDPASWEDLSLDRKA
jgi:cation diffusion facilitator family transporter